jgi:predicted ATPase
MNETSTLEANLFRLLHKWADASSLDLLKTLASGAKNPFVFVFTHRPVEEDHPLQQLLRDLKDCRMHVTDIKVNGLSEDNVRELVSNMLEVKRADLCGALSNYLCRVTNGSESIVVFACCLLTLRELFQSSLCLF